MTPAEVSNLVLAAIALVVVVVVLAFWLSWFAATRNILDEVKKWREEDKQRHEEIVELLKKG